MSSLSETPREIIPPEREDEKKEEAKVSKEVSGLSYYQKTFATIITSVIECYSPIFLSSELALVKQVLDLDDDSEKLLIRLYFRKHDWQRVCDLDYREIKSVPEATSKLRDETFVELGSQYEEDYWNLLTKEEIMQLAQEGFVLPQNKLSLMKRGELLTSIVTKRDGPKQAKINLSSSGELRVEKRPPIDVKQKCGEILKINRPVVETLNRFVNLFLLNWDQVSEDGDLLNAPINIGAALLVDLNKRKYPNYEIIRSQPLFSSREDFLEYEEAMMIEREELVIGPEIIGKWKNSIKEQKLKKEVNYFLKRYTPAWIYTRILSNYVTSLESLGMYNEANAILFDLLSQEEYFLGARAIWWERLIINYSRHLKNQSKAIEVGERALKDPLVRTGRQLSIRKRLHRLKTGTAFSEVEYEPPTIIINAEPKSVPTFGIRLLYEWHDDGQGDLQEGSVEDLVLHKWRSEGWTGYHSENALTSMLFSLVFWDELFMPIPDVFQSPFQAAPLDLFSDAFYPTRQEQIESRLKLVEEEGCSKILTMNYVQNYGTYVIGGHWDLFTLHDLLSITRGLGNKAVVNILRLLAEDYKHFCHGFPDLVIYRSIKESRPDVDTGEEREEETVQVKLIEVKSERDRLSDSQRYWHSVCLANNVEMFVAKVIPERPIEADEETGRKRKRSSKPKSPSPSTADSDIQNT